MIKYRILGDLEDGTFIVVLETPNKTYALGIHRTLTDAVENKFYTSSEFTDIHLASNESDQWEEILP